MGGGGRAAPPSSSAEQHDEGDVLPTWLKALFACGGRTDRMKSRISSADAATLFKGKTPPYIDVTYFAQDTQSQAELLNQEGLRQNKNTDPEGAAILFEQAAFLEPTVPLYIINAANMHLKNSAHALALPLYERALKLRLSPSQHDMVSAKILLARWGHELQVLELRSGMPTTSSEVEDALRAVLLRCHPDKQAARPLEKRLAPAEAAARTRDALLAAEKLKGAIAQEKLNRLLVVWQPSAAPGSPGKKVIAE